MEIVAVTLSVISIVVACYGPSVAAAAERTLAALTMRSPPLRQAVDTLGES